MASIQLDVNYRYNILKGVSGSGNSIKMAPGKNVNHMVLLTSGPDLVLLEESEPNSSFIALTSLTTPQPWIGIPLYTA